MNCLLFALLYRKRLSGAIALRRWPSLAMPFGHWVIRTNRWDVMYGTATDLPWWSQLNYSGVIKRRKPVAKILPPKKINRRV